MADPIRDPVHRSRYSFERDGDDLLVDTWLEPKGILPPHMHPRQTEKWWVVEGRARMLLGHAKRVITPESGEILVPPRTKHALASMGEEVHLRCRVTPPAGLQAFLEGSAAAAEEGLFMKGGIPKSWRGAKWAAGFLREHGDDVVMAFPPRPVQRALIAVVAR